MGAILATSDLRERIKTKRDFKISEPIEIPEWETTLYVRSLGATAKDILENFMVIENEKREKAGCSEDDAGVPIGIRALLVRLAACDENGIPVFQVGDESWLAEKDQEAMERLFKPAMKLNKLSAKDEKDEVKD